MGITVAEVYELRQKLDALPEQDAAEREVSKQDAVALMARQVRQLQQRGYSMDAVAQFISSHGLQISTHALRSYLSRAQRTTASKRTAKSRTSQVQLMDKQQNISIKEKSPFEEPSVKEVKPSRVTTDTAKSTSSSTTPHSSSFTPREDSEIL
jgi:hypothetical protein